MPVLNVAFVGSETLARELAKKGDVRDIESYVFKQVVNGYTRVLSLLRPLKHPERLRPLLSVLNVAQAGLVEVSRIDAALGEVLVAFACAGVEMGHVIINPGEGDWVDPEQVGMILEQAGLGTWTVHLSIPDLHELRTGLLASLDSMPRCDQQLLVLPVDQHFNVKGVGLVAIGYVQAGTVSKHDTVEVLPAGEFGVTRSLQVMDDDVEVAVAGDRVGLAMRNLREEALHRGCMISHPESDALIRHDSSSFILKPAPFQKRTLAADDVIHAALDLQFVVGRVLSVADSRVEVVWESPLWIRSQHPPPVLIAQLDAHPMRMMGVAREMSPL